MSTRRKRLLFTSRPCRCRRYIGLRPRVSKCPRHTDGRLRGRGGGTVNDTGHGFSYEYFGSGSWRQEVVVIDTYWDVGLDLPGVSTRTKISWMMLSETTHAFIRAMNISRRLRLVVGGIKRGLNGTVLIQRARRRKHALPIGETTAQGTASRPGLLWAMHTVSNRNYSNYHHTIVLLLLLLVMELVRERTSRQQP